MLNLSNFMFESNNVVEDKLRKMKKQLTEQDIEQLRYLVLDKTKNQNYSIENIEHRFWSGDLKDKYDEYFEQISKYLDNAGLTAKNISDYYLLSKSGKQFKIEVIAQVAWMIIAHFQ